MYINLNIILMGIGDWGLGIGPNPQSPIPNPQMIFIKLTFNSIIYINIASYILI